MAKPRVFVSSTYYDLKHIRASMDIFIESLGFESILSEKGDIAYNPEIALDESCYKEVENADILTLIVGGRYGSAASRDNLAEKDFFSRYDSITKLELEHAVKREIPIYILIESSVYSEYETYLRNKPNKTIQYAHVDSINVFELIETILLKPKNNPIHTFEKFSDIETWLREQWAGLFREYLIQRLHYREISDLKTQVDELRDVSSTLKVYMENVLEFVAPEKSERVIESESSRLTQLRRLRIATENSLATFVASGINSTPEDIVELIVKSRTFNGLLTSILKEAQARETREDEANSIIDLLKEAPMARHDVNQIRAVMGKNPIK